MTYSPPPGTQQARIPGPRHPHPARPRVRAGLWRRCLCGGLTLWALVALITCVTTNTVPFAALLLLAGPLIPATVTTWIYERRGRGSSWGNTP